MQEILGTLEPAPGGVYLDCTAGLGGHAAAVARRLGPEGTVVLNDMDPGNLARAAGRVCAVPAAPKVVQIRGNFADAPRAMAQRGIAADAVLADLGFASPQVDDPARGFSFRKDGPLDMRMDPDGPVTAADLVRTLPEEDLAEILREYGQERHARSIAKRIVEARNEEPILTTGRLAGIIRAKAPARRRGEIDPATRAFQAVRIAVNDELGSLGAMLEAIGRRGAVVGASAAGGGWLATGARVGIVSFHSLEDRAVKQAFKGIADRGKAAAVSAKPVVATAEETDRNPRARSAKLRWLRLASE